MLHHHLLPCAHNSEPSRFPQRFRSYLLTYLLWVHPRCGRPSQFFIGIATYLPHLSYPTYNMPLSLHSGTFCPPTSKPYDGLHNFGQCTSYNEPLHLIAPYMVRGLSLIFHPFFVSSWCFLNFRSSQPFLRSKLPTYYNLKLYSPKVLSFTTLIKHMQFIFTLRKLRVSPKICFIKFIKRNKIKNSISKQNHVQLTTSE